MEKKVLIGVSIVSFSIFVTFSLFHSLSPYTTVSDLVGIENAKNVQVIGDIVKGSIFVKDNKTFFKITDSISEIDVVYNGLINYYDGQVVVVGDVKNGKLYATQVLRKCHTEYKVGE